MLEWTGSEYLGFWTDGSEFVYENFAEGEPNGEDGAEECLWLYGSDNANAWNDAPCDHTSSVEAYVCKITCNSFCSLRSKSLVSTKFSRL